ncbi:MAG: 16S rRNA (adenine(1518)-N(6)/adenine(1519)-N(6))-dimethyltransferase RsmA [Lactimicrobium massiliense]|uniref:16S rRNA (adenine(1518)-N(6)/adenine(1519)-N(6))- dimethyltransferase RsmA n=1 Tax=Lactimicrobium massiliense TaxID=2161814 RepID=UPI000D5507C1|nr:16S rRNA (adenine(1518)-N(6)/adenine(1519)-N(6))-dimethyltransferase RsmA [Lactimicrobium massiliense]MDD6229268.1 16S rRNA (adenine(1518)-N(6)/adenine(1519)-N(6))-dimethyltransferase RsmA [Lactimicrobium massiliense]MDD6559617.1 16S rRNA (adenine(1518)-N(6)/adenine(1519)-N(6))-dimethyltransferase RsmA [Lactimicrobium massiliense]MDD6726311.1 16S rRNA (adenine(1518)-N(6)/adenine(1519)-N(6))-dimethyltransferase RsmA [Lactimicrobium massiliense]
MTKWIATPSRTKQILADYGLHAKKGYGQNFLVDPMLVERCAQQAHAEDAVIEIGPGIGSLTEQLARVAKHVTAYEVDEDLKPVLADTLSPYDNIEIIWQDFLTCDIKTKVQELREQYGSVSVCANLPYYITTPVLFRLFEEAPEIPYITVMVQKEVGERFAAGVNTQEYGALSVEAQTLYDVRKLFNVPARSFNPSPNVDSVIIQFARRSETVDPEDLQKFFTFVKACFRQRRKTVYNNLRDYLGSGDQALAVLERAGIDPRTRAQELSKEELRKLYDTL